MVDFPSPSKNSNKERWPIFFLDRGADWADAVDAAVDVVVVAGAVDATVDHEGCHMERGVVAAEFRLDAVIGDAVDQDGCHMEQGVPVSAFGQCWHDSTTTTYYLYSLVPAATTYLHRYHKYARVGTSCTYVGVPQTNPRMIGCVQYT